MSLDDVLNNAVFTPQCKYYTANEFNSAFNTTQIDKPIDFSFMHVNIRSLQKNFDTFSEFLSILKNFSFS